MITKEVVHLEGIELDAYLNLVLPCMSQVGFDRVALPYLRERFPTAMDKNARLQTKSADDLARRRIVRRYDYLGPATGTSRVWRGRMPWSWYEEELMDRAHLHINHKPDAESSKTPIVSHTALFLQRTEEEVQEYITQKLNTRQGIQGFDL